MHVSERPEHDRPSSAAVAATKPASPSVIATALQRFAFQDWYMLGFVVVILMIVLHGSGPERDKCIRYALFNVAAIFGSLLAIRGQIVRGFVSALLYRFVVWWTILGVFFELTFILPEASSRVVDADILAFDLKVFGFEPAIAWDKYVNQSTTEWFSFFYYGYFFLIGLHTFPFAFGVRKNTPMLNEFSLGIVLIFCTAHIVYMIVPGYGPHHLLAGQFQNTLDGPLWWKLVRGAVDAGGSRKDIFPSLHTGAPTFLALFQFRHRKSLPFKYTWPFCAFFASQMVLATMFLRWHWLIDIFAGLTLASLALFFAVRIQRWERARRERLAYDPIWHDLF